MVSSKPTWALSVLGGALLTLAGCSTSSGLASERVADAALPIVGGQLDSLHTNVFGLVLRKADGVATCSSTLLAPNLLLTARHCVSEHVEDPVVCGAAGLGVADGPENFFATNAVELERDARWFHAAEVHVPTEGDDTCGFDVALIVLTENVPATLATPAVPRIDRDVAQGETYVAVGYGLDDSGEAGGRRVRDDLSVSCEPGSCGFGVRVSEFIGETGVCSGDSGGPALDSEGKVVGVVSRGGEDCSTPVYSTVTAWHDLIQEVAAHAAELGGYAAPFWVKSGTSDAPPPPPKLAAAGESCASLSCVEGAACFRSAPDAEPTCAAICSTDADCTAGTACQPVGDGSSSVCLAALEKTHHTDSSCALGVGSEPASAWSTLIGMLGLAAFVRRARRRRQAH
jgi:MYXO-CTERM domain-containing protein